MITSMHIENFKCFKEFDIELGPFNVLIGPNDTGKTALLQAIRIVSCLERGASLNPGQILERVGVPVGVESRYSKAEGNAELAIRVHHRPRNTVVNASLIATPSRSGSGHDWAMYSEKGFEPSGLGKVGFYQFDPRALRRPTKLSTSMASDGTGLSGFIARMALDRDGTMDSLEEDFKRRFPFYMAIVTVPKPEAMGDVAHLRFRTVHGPVLPCQSVSDGVMLSLAFMAVCHAKESPDILLIEEPENCVHHSNLKDIVETLKQLSKDKGVQVIMTTHSPYLLDEVDFSTVQVFQKDKEGAVHAKRLSDFEGAGEISDMFSTGEKWSLLAEKYGI
jgi:predicted ATPase